MDIASFIDALAYLTFGGFQNRQRIAAAERNGVEVKALVLFVNQFFEERRIAAFTLSFAANEDSSPLENGAAAVHPICGIAP